MKELRFGLVCYGGVSLAVYMHGVTKELHKLVLASTAYERQPGVNPFTSKDPHDTAGVYFDLLARIHQATGVRTRVVVDIVSGTSAGGINGICLAKALAGNRSLSSLKQLWMEKADIGVLLRGPRSLPTRVRLAVILAGSVARFRLRPPLRGDEMCVWLHDAFTTMDRQEQVLAGVASLMPEDHRLELFVPVTDFWGYDREIPIEDPHFLRERTHRDVLTFRADGSHHDDFTAAHNHFLAFAARATSSFPGAFAPLTVGDYRSAVGDAAALEGQLDAFFPAYRLARNSIEEAVFIDGGVLDNFPFATTISAIAARPAASEVDRQLLYIEPDPSRVDTELHESRSDGQPKVPGIFATVWGGIAAIPRDEPIVDDLARLAERNDAVRRVRDIIETSFDTISGRVHDMLSGVPEDAPTTVNPEDLVESRRTIDALVVSEAGFAYGTYLRLRVVDVVDQYSGQVAAIRNFPAGTYHVAFVTAILRAWVAATFRLAADPANERRSFLEGFDLGYVQRQIRFVIAAFSWWYSKCNEPGYPTRAQLDNAKSVLYQRLRDVRAVSEQLAADDPIRRLLGGVFDEDTIRRTVLERHEQAIDYIAEHHDTLSELQERVANAVRQHLPTVEARLHDDVLELTQSWSPPVKGAVVTRYLGFPFWDALVFPVEALTGVGERDTVEVVRMSPRDSCLLQAPDPAKKLAGASLAHFGAFFDRRGRESDYLWGRLDAAERLVTLLLHAPDAAELEPANRDACRPAFGAILAEERAPLSHASPLIEYLEQQVNS